MSSTQQARYAANENLQLERRAEQSASAQSISTQFAPAAVGQTFAMTGASRRHNLIVSNVVAALTMQLRHRACEVYPGRMRVRVRETGLYTYPDVVVVCGSPQYDDSQEDTLLNPMLIVEVLSDFTEGYDRGRKFAHSRTIPSLAEFLIISQHERRVEQYTRQSEGRWLLQDFTNPGSHLQLTLVDCAITLADIYDKVALDEQAI